MGGDSLDSGLVIREVLPYQIITDSIALFIVGFFEWGLVYFTNWEKQVQIAYARYLPRKAKLKSQD